MEEGILITDIAGTFGPDWVDGFNKEIQSMVETEKAGYWVRQSAIAQREHSMGRQIIDSLGQKVASVDAATYHRWGQQEGYDFWNDRKEIKHFLRDNPECKVPGFWHGLR